MRKFILIALMALCPLSSALSQITLESFSDALKIAVTNDIDGALQSQSAQEELRLSKRNVGGFFPVLDFALTDGARVQKGKDDTKNKTIEFGLTQKIFNGGKTFLEWRMQKEKSFYNFLSAQKERENFKDEFLRLYYNTLLLTLKSCVLDKNVENAARIVDAAALEKEQGMITNAGYLETLLQFKKMELEAKVAGDELEKSAQELKRAMGLSRSQKVVLKETEIFEKALDRYQLLEGLEEKKISLCQGAIKNSVDLKLASAELAWAKKMRSMQKRFMLPSVSIRGGVAFSGRNYPLTSPVYSMKVILSFDDNPWLKTSVSRQAGFSNGKLESLSDSISGQALADTSYFGRLRLNKIDIARKKLGVENAKKRIDDSVWDLLKRIEQSQESFLLTMESVRIKELKLALSAIELEQGRIKKSDYLEEMGELSKQKIQALSLLKERDYMAKQLETMSKIDLRKKEEI